MPTQLEVRAEIADKLAALARARGVSVDDLLREVLDGMESPHPVAAELSLQEFERDLDALAEGLEHLPAGDEGTYSREDIYMDHN